MIGGPRQSLSIRKPLMKTEEISDCVAVDPRQITTIELKPPYPSLDFLPDQ